VICGNCCGIGLSVETRRAIVVDARSRDFRIALKITKLKKQEDDDF
jgi:hypothetical protein